MDNLQMKKLLIKASIFSGICLSVMLWRCVTKHIMITDAAGVEIDRGETATSYNLLVDRNVPEGQKGKLIIPLSKTVGSDDIVLEDRYLDHELIININGREEDFYLDNPIATDLMILNSAVCISEKGTGGVSLDFGLNDLYANESSLTESNTIEVRFFKPYEEYKRIVVVDPAAGGIDEGISFDGLTEKDVTLDIALALKNIAEKDENSTVKFYFTRLSDTNVDDNRRQALLSETGADLLVGIGAYVSEDTSVNGIGCTFNNDFYLRGFNNASFAGILETNCVSKTGSAGIFIEPAKEDDYLLMNAKIPAARVVAGVLNGETDNKMLQDETYINKIALGIYQGITQAFEEME